MLSKLITLTLIIVLVNLEFAEAWVIEKKEGQIYTLKKGKKQNLEKGSRLIEGQVVFTGKNSKALLTEGESKIWLGSLTRIELQKPGSEKEKISWIAVLYGKLRAKIAKPEAKKYQYRVRSATAGVRGTEFFIDASDRNGFICTLEGEVEVRSEKSKIAVTEGKGVLIADNIPVRVGETSQFLMDQWVAETSFSDSKVHSMPDMYSQVNSLKPLGSNKKLFAGVSGSIYWCDNFNVGFDKSADSQSCTRSYIAPIVEYGVMSKWTLEPFINLVSYNYQATIDSVPSYTGNVAQSVGVSQFHYTLQGNNAEYKVGIMKAHWADGVLLSERSWSQEPQRLAGVNLNFNESWGRYKILGSKGVETETKLDGITHIDFAGINFYLLRDKLQLYLLHSNFGKLKASSTLYTHGHELMNLGAYFVDKYSSADIKVSTLLQRHTRHMNPHSSNHKGVDGGMLDAEVGAYLKGNKSYRVSLRGMLGSENLMTVLDDYYQLGISGIQGTRNNLIQVRLKGELAWDQNQTFVVEWLHNTQSRAGGFTKHGEATKDYSYLGSEIDLLWNYQWDSIAVFRLGSYVYKPANISTKNDSSFGAIARIDFSL